MCASVLHTCKQRHLLLLSYSLSLDATLVPQLVTEGARPFRRPVLPYAICCVSGNLWLSLPGRHASGHVYTGFCLVVSHYSGVLALRNVGIFLSGYLLL